MFLTEKFQVPLVNIFKISTALIKLFDSSNYLKLYLKNFFSQIIFICSLLYKKT